MSTTVTGNPPQGQTASHRDGAGGHTAPRVRRGLRPPRASTGGSFIQVALEIGSGPGSAGTLFGQLEADLEAAIGADQAVFASNAAAGSDAFAGLQAGIVAAALVMAVGCGWGLTRRLAEYR